MTRTATILPLPTNRDERALRSKWARRDELARQLREIDREIAPLHLKVARARGYFCAVSREALQRELEGEAK